MGGANVDDRRSSLARRGGHLSGSSHGSSRRHETSVHATPTSSASPYESPDAYYHVPDGIDPYEEAIYSRTQMPSVAYSNSTIPENYYEMNDTIPNTFSRPNMTARPDVYARASFSTPGSSGGTMYQHSMMEPREFGSASLAGSSTVLDSRDDPREARHAPIGTWPRSTAGMIPVADDGTIELDPSMYERRSGWHHTNRCRI